ncbi:MAG TPA: mechanosensitive ion channel family protein, partial [Desulfobacteria bacterium]|nr:mechanosensitive ion channel family protein [Desulfobacteria bacterium]
MIEEILQREIFYNRISEYLICLAILVGGILAAWVVESLVLRRLKSLAKKTSSTWDDFLVDRIRRTGIPLAYLGIVQAALRVLTLTPRAERIIDMAGIVLLTLLGIVFTVALVRYGFEEYMRKRGEDPSRDRALKGVV